MRSTTILTPANGRWTTTLDAIALNPLIQTIQILPFMAPGAQENVQAAADLAKNSGTTNDIVPVSR